MTLLISSVFTYDEDAGNYIQAVEAADGQTLEGATRKAINNFVIGCKQDGIWNAIKASCILSGARTLNGALVPLVGAAPTNFNFVDGDYNRKTGLAGNGSTKHLVTNRLLNQGNLISSHLAVYMSTNHSGGDAGIIGTENVATSDFIYLQSLVSLHKIMTANQSIGTRPSANTFYGTTRSSQIACAFRANGSTSTAVSSNNTGFSLNTNPYYVFRGGFGGYSNARLAFYSIGETLDLALLDARVTALINAFGVTIP